MNDLKLALTQMIENVRKQKEAARTAGAKKPNGKKPALSVEQLREMLSARGGDSGSIKRNETARAIIRWQDQAIVLIETHTECRTCGSKFVSVDQNLMIQRWHKTYGLHYTPIDPGAARNSTLPRRTKIVEITARVCGNCWVEVAPFEVKQRSLTFGPENQGIMVPEKKGDRPIFTDLFSPGEGITGEHTPAPKQGALPIRHPQPTTRWPSTFWPPVLASQVFHPHHLIKE